MALKKVKGNIERLFDKNLTDLVRGIRNNKENEAKYIAQCMEEIKVELRQDNIAVKANAVAKLTYLQMLGYDISWAVFNIIEVMSSNKFTYKRIGYLAASQSFHSESELLMLTTNMIRKELNSSNQYEAGLALSGLSCFVSADLARDLANDIMTLMSSTKPYLRMKAVLMMYKVFLKYPEALRPAFPRLKEKLEDPDPGVQSAAVNVVCELAGKNPKNYLSLAPIFFKLMTTSTNNWMLIKIIKLFGALTPLEPRLGKKLMEPLANLIRSTSAVSLLYECINTVMAVLISISSGMPNDSGMPINLCVQKLSILIEDSDQNLKYLGLLAMSKILKTHPKSVQAHKDLILQCLDDKDESIRMRALGLLYGMVSRKNLMEIVKKLMVHMEGAEGTLYRDELLKRIVEICSQNNYQFITDFEWYITVLVELTQMETAAKYGKLLSEQLVDVCVRVHAIRSFAVSEMDGLLEEWALGTGTGGALPTVLCSAAYIVGEYAQDFYLMYGCLNWLMEPGGLPGPTKSAYLHAALKIFTKILQQCKTKSLILKSCDLMLEKIQQQLCSAHIEVQERASCTYLIVKLVKEYLTGEKEEEKDEIVVPQAQLLGGLDSNNVEDSSEEKKEDAESPESLLPPEFNILVKEMMELYSGELNPIAPKAQKKVLVPEGLDLDAWINTPPESSASSSDAEGENDTVNSSGKKMGFLAQSWGEPEEKSIPEPTPDQIQKMKEAREQAQLHNPHYLKPAKSSNNTSQSFKLLPDTEFIPIADIALDVPLKVHEKRSDKYLLAASNKTKKEKRSTKKSKKNKRSKYEDDSDSDVDENVEKKWVVSTAAEVPEGWTGDADGASDTSVGDGPPDPHQALNIDLNIPLRGEEEPKVTRTKDRNILTSNNAIKLTDSKEDFKKSKHGKHSNSKDKSKSKGERASGKEHKKKHVKGDGDAGEDGEKLHSSKKESKKSKDEKKKKKSSKKDKQEAKVGYEEALGISTPSKEFA